jgi:hypothetical protein
MTLKDMFENDKSLEVGDLVMFENGTSFLVGDATPYHQPINNDCGFGWDWDSALCKKKILKIENLLKMSNTTKNKSK